MFFDIEVSMEDNLPNVETANNKITSIALYDQITDEYHVLALDEYGSKDNYDKDNTYVKFFSDEYDLLSFFLDLWEGINPTIITGWNTNYFDVPYLYRRLSEVLGRGQANRLSSINKVKFSKYRKKYQIAGISSLDYLDLYRKFTYIEQPNYRLDTIGKLEVGMGKVEYDGTLDELFEQDLDKFVEYNLTDVKIVVELEKKMKLIELVRGICHIGHVQYEDYGFSSRFLEGTIVTYLHRKGLIVTDKQANARQMMNDRDDTDKFIGAYVKVPNPSKCDWVFSLDLQSLYPSIIMSLNISPETKVGSVTNWNNKSFVDGEMDKFSVETDGIVDLNREQFDSFMAEHNLAISSNGILYQQNKRGIIPEILERWFDQRIEFQKLMNKHASEGDIEMAQFYDRRQHIQKIFLNSLYGVLGLPIFRFFDLDNAVAVTTTGQDVIKNSEVFVNDLFEQLGAEPKSSAELAKYELALKQEAVKRKERFVAPSEKDWCIYIDTDSLYFSSLPLKHKLKGDLQSATIKLSRFVEQKLNEHYDKIAVDYFNCPNHRFHIKGEIIAKSGIWITKKRYAMLKVYDLEKNTEIEPKLIVKGLDIVRSTFPIVFKEYMRNFIISLLNDTDKIDIDKVMVDFVGGLKDVPFRRIARNTAAKNVTKYKTSNDRLGHYMKSTPMHVKSVINYNHLLKEFGIEKQFPPINDGEKIKYVMLRQNPYHIDTLAFKDYEDPPQIVKFLKTYSDHQRLFDAELKKKLQDFYNALGWGELPINIKVDRNILNMFGL